MGHCYVHFAFVFTLSCKCNIKRVAGIFLVRPRRQGYGSKGRSRTCSQVILHKSKIHLYAVKVILSEVSAIFYFILKEIGTIKRFYSVYGVYYGLLHFI